MATVVAGGAGLLAAGVLGSVPLATASATMASLPPTTAPPTTAPSTTAPPQTAAPTTTTETTPRTVPIVDPFQPLPRPSAGASVSIVDYAFSPATITIAAGSTVTWTNTGASIHSVTSDSGAFDSSPSCPTGPCIDPGGTYSHTFAQAGQFAYHCRVHPNMTATVVVNAAATTTTAAGSTTTSAPGGPPVSGGGSPTPTTVASQSTGPQLAFTGAPSEELWLAAGALFTIAIGLALRPRRRPFPVPVPSAGTDPSPRSN
jgi:plastocyanin